MRAGWKMARWLDENGKPLDLIAVLKTSDGTDCIDRPIKLWRHKRAAPLRLRLVAIRKPKNEAEKTQAKVRREAAKEKDVLADETLVAAEWLDIGLHRLRHLPAARSSIACNSALRSGSRSVRRTLCCGEGRAMPAVPHRLPDAQCQIGTQLGRLVGITSRRIERERHRIAGEGFELHARRGIVEHAGVLGRALEHDRAHRLRVGIEPDHDGNADHGGAGCDRSGGHTAGRTSARAAARCRPPAAPSGSRTTDRS